jgi:endogenous inhibitor of DNA gyrase (YacG/DUF329 family)
MVRLVCSACQKGFDAQTSDVLPFCSVRCQQIDLGRWLDERHGLPWEAEDAADSEYIEP